MKPPVSERCLDLISIGRALALEISNQTAGVGRDHRSVLELAECHQINAEFDFPSQLSGLLLGPNRGKPTQPETNRFRHALAGKILRALEEIFRDFDGDFAHLSHASNVTIHRTGVNAGAGCTDL